MHPRDVYLDRERERYKSGKGWDGSSPCTQGTCTWIERERYKSGKGWDGSSPCTQGTCTWIEREIQVREGLGWVVSMHPRDVYLDRERERYKSGKGWDGSSPCTQGTCTWIEREIQVREGLGWVVSMHPRDVYLDRERDTSQGRVGMGRLHAPQGRVPGRRRVEVLVVHHS